MAFEKISKGEFKVIDGFDVFCNKEHIIQTTNMNDAPFIAYCFNLQQRYDISKLEEAVSALENSKQVIENLIASKRIVNLDEALAYYEQLLKEIKK